MRNVLAVVGLNLPSGTLLFTDEEVPGVVEVTPTKLVTQRRTQADDTFIYVTGSVHYEIRVPFRIARYETLLKLNEIFELDERMDVYPHYPDDTVTHYEVILTNPEVFQQRWRRGYPLANYEITFLFREPRGAVCVPPS